MTGNAFMTPAALERLLAYNAVAFPWMLDGQHCARVWEYQLALDRIQRLESFMPLALQIADVGGGGSRFCEALNTCWSGGVTVIDAAPLHPKVPATVRHVAQALDGAAPEALRGQFDAVTCLSVLEHVPDPDRLLVPMLQLLKPGGLLILTMDAVNVAPQGDVFHFHWMRERIYTTSTLLDLHRQLEEWGCHPVGPLQYDQYAGPAIFDYTFAAVVVTAPRAL